MNGSPPPDLARLLRKNSSYVVLGKLITPVLTFLTTVIMVRALPVADYGVYNLCFAVLTFVGFVSSLGMINVFKRFLPEFRQRGEFSHIRTLLKAGLAVRLLLASLVVGLLFVFSKQAGTLFRIADFSGVFKAFAASVLFFIEIELIGSALTSLFLHRAFVVSQIVYSIVRIGLVWAVLKFRWGLNGLLLAEALSFAWLFANQAVRIWQEVRQTGPGSAQSPFPWKRIFRFGGLCYFNEMGEQILDVSTDCFVISAVLGSSMVGLFSFANEVMKMASRWMPHRLLMDLITPAFFTQYARTGHVRDLVRMFHLVTKTIAFVFVPVVIGILILGDRLIVHVFDARYLEALPVLWIAAVFTALNAFAFPLGLVVESVEKVEIHLIGKVFSIYNLIGDLLVVRPFGIVGVALVTSTAVLAKNLFTFFAIRRTVPLTWQTLPLVKIALNAGVMGALVFLLRPMASNLFGLIAVVLVGMVCYIGISVLNKPFSRDERRVINGLLPKPVFVF